jgi:hypothetical protein
VSGRWKGQRLDDGLPILTTTFEDDGIRYEVEQFAYPLNGPPAERRGDMSMVLLQQVTITELQGRARSLPVSMAHRRLLPPYIDSTVDAERQGDAVLFRERVRRQVLLALEGADRRPMQKDDKGIWTITTPPLDPDLYGYSFVADGVRMIDPANSATKPNLLNLSNVVHVPGPSSLGWEVNDVPRGTVHQHFYRSGVLRLHAARLRRHRRQVVPGALPAAWIQRRCERLDGGGPRARDSRQLDRTR